MKALFLLSLIPLIPFAGANPGIVASNDFDYLEIPVFDDQPQKITFSHTYKVSGGGTRIFNIYLYSQGNTGTEILSYTNTYSTSTLKDSPIIEHSLPNTIFQVKIRFEIIHKDAVAYSKSFVTSYRKMPQSFNIENKESISSEFEAVRYTKKGGVSHFLEKYYFNGFVNEITPTNQIFDISGLTIKYEAPDTFLNERRELEYRYCQIVFDDLDDLLHAGNFTPPAIRSFQIKLVYYESDELYHLEWKDKFYVDPLTLRMSNTHLDGYVETPYLYIPRGYEYCSNLLKYQISIRSAGANKSFLFIKGSVNQHYEQIGMCGIGDYCLTSTVGTPNFEIGENVTYK